MIIDLTRCWVWAAFNKEQEAWNFKILLLLEIIFNLEIALVN